MSTEFIAFLLDQLSGIDDVMARRMFGGHGLYAGEVFFALVFEDVLYFKVDETTRRDYLRAGMKPFRPYADRRITFKYYEVPVGVVEDAEELTRWARRAIAVASKKEDKKGSRKTNNSS